MRSSRGRWKRLKADYLARGRADHFTLFESLRPRGPARRRPPSYKTLAELRGWTVNDVTNRLAATRRDFRGHVLRLLRESCASDDETTSARVAGGRGSAAPERRRVASRCAGGGRGFSRAGPGYAASGEAAASARAGTRRHATCSAPSRGATAFIAGFDYRGVWAYSLTCCTFRRLPHFADADASGAAIALLESTALECEFAVLAYLRHARPRPRPDTGHHGQRRIPPVCPIVASAHGGALLHDSSGRACGSPDTSSALYGTTRIWTAWPSTSSTIPSGQDWSPRSMRGRGSAVAWCVDRRARLSPPGGRRPRAAPVDVGRREPRSHALLESLRVTSIHLRRIADNQAYDRAGEHDLPPVVRPVGLRDCRNEKRQEEADGAAEQQAGIERPHLRAK